MYNKLFSKILDSSIWLEDAPTRLVWMTLLAVMDEDGFAQFASAANVSHRARVSLNDATRAITCLESPDPNSSNPDNDGRRIERVPGGWLVLNAERHREMVTRAAALEQNRNRVRKHRAKKTGNALTITSNASDDDDTDHDTDLVCTKQTLEQRFDRFWAAYPNKKAKPRARGSFWKLSPSEDLLGRILSAISEQSRSDQWTKDRGAFIPYPASWLNAKRWEDEPAAPLPSQQLTKGGKGNASRDAAQWAIQGMIDRGEVKT